jgi:4a-hydroxytetrahydrobiopterin dehydratase
LEEKFLCMTNTTAELSAPVCLWHKDSCERKEAFFQEGTFMDDLKQGHCVPCEGGVPQASEGEIAEYMTRLPGWKVIEVDGEKRLTREFMFNDFAHALAFTNRVGALAEQEGHHPALLTEWGKVTVAWWTHAIKGLHRNDFIMAAKTDEAFQASEGAKK